MAIHIIRLAAPPPDPQIFPPAIHASGRYLVNASGTPFFLQGDTPWSLAAQLTNSEITTYLNDRAAKGFTAVMFNVVEHFYTGQSPRYLNVDGVAPFASMTDWGSALNEAYWSRVDHIVNSAKALGMICVINPAYLGYPSTEEGWDTEVSAESDADLQTYGTRLANRYTQGNVIWCLGGDRDPDNTLRDKQWNIVTGIRSVRTTDIITAHGQQGSSPYTTWSGKTGYTLNNGYSGSVANVYDVIATEYARSPVLPCFFIEGLYEQERGTPITAQGLRRQTYQAICSGACGQFFGNSPIWHFESPDAPYSYTGTWESNLDSAGSVDQSYVAALINSIEWWKLEPKTGTQLVTTSLSSGDSRICPALASDGTFALIYRPASGSSTVNMAAMTGVSSVRARFFDPDTGTYSTASGSPFSPSGTQSISWPGERILHLDQA